MHVVGPFQPVPPLGVVSVEVIQGDVGGLTTVPSVLRQKLVVVMEGESVSLSLSG